MQQIAEAPLEYRAMSWDDYLALPEDVRSEWVDGVVVVSPQPSPSHQWTVKLLLRLLDDSLPGTASFPGLNLRLPRNRVRVPDVVVFRERVHDLFVTETPLLVVEVLSPSTRSEDTMRKSREYAEGGIAQYWIVDPQLRRIDVFANHDGDWDPLLQLDEATPVGKVAVVDAGEVPVDLRQLLA